MTDQNSQSTQEFELSRLIISTLNLEMQAADIAPEAPLFGEGLGLDSIDILEIALAQSDSKDNKHIFSSLRSLNHHIRQHQPTQT